MFTSIQAELKEIFAHLEKDYHLKSGHLSDFIPDFELNGIDSTLRSGMVILPAKLFKGYDRRGMVMAGVVQLIYLAQEIHNRIPDDCAKDAPQFPVLVGDYLFSKFFKKLSDHDLLEWLAPLSSIICEMNEGGITRWKVLEKGMGEEADYLEVLLQEYGSLMGMACKIGGLLAGCSQEAAIALEQFGINLGMAWGGMKEGFPIEPRDFLNIARLNLMKLPGGPEREEMINIILQMEEMSIVYHSPCSTQKSAAAN